MAYLVVIWLHQEYSGADASPVMILYPGAITSIPTQSYTLLFLKEQEHFKDKSYVTIQCWTLTVVYIKIVENIS